MHGKCVPHITNYNFETESILDPQHTVRITKESIPKTENENKELSKRVEKHRRTDENTATSTLERNLLCSCSEAKFEGLQHSVKITHETKRRNAITAQNIRRICVYSSAVKIKK